MTSAEYQAMHARQHQAGVSKSPAGRFKPASVPKERRTPPSPPKEPRQPASAQEPKEKEPAEKHVQLPPPPAEIGPWAIGHWTVSRATTYEPRARVVLTGPADEFEQLLAHLQAFKP